MKRITRRTKKKIKIHRCVIKQMLQMNIKMRKIILRGNFVCWRVSFGREMSPTRFSGLKHRPHNLSSLVWQNRTVAVLKFAATTWKRSFRFIENNVKFDTQYPAHHGNDIRHDISFYWTFHFTQKCTHESPTPRYITAGCYISRSYQNASFFFFNTKYN